MSWLTIPNPKRAEAERFGRWVGNIPRELTYYRWLDSDDLLIPRGAAQELRRIAEEPGLRLAYTLDTTQPASVDFDSSIVLTEPQETAVEKVLRRRMGQLVAPAGAGKTVMGLEVVGRRRQPTLWLTHTKELAHQTRERAVAMLGLEPADIGMVGDGKKTIGERLTIAMVQTLAKGLPAGLRERIGHVVVDECHHVPAAQMAAVVSQIPAHYVLGLSATPYRRDKLDRVIGFYLGPVAATIEKRYLPERLITPSVRKVETGVEVDGDSFTELVTQLVSHAGRNRLITGQVAAAAEGGRRPLVLTERVEHAELLAGMLADGGCAVAVLHGGRTRTERAEIRSQVERGDVSAIVATGQLIGEGFDSPPLDTLFIATPLSYRGRLIQYLGRISRTAPEKRDAIVVDYCDDSPMLWASWAKRRDVYDGLDCARLRAA
jgi:superfamily II DNA or RNA helicase